MAHRCDSQTTRPRATVTRHTSALGRWELATAPPAEALRPFAREYVGWSEQVSAPLCRRELPTEEAPLIINFGAAFRLFAPGDSRRHLDLASFITGAYDTYQLVESSGASSGVQVNFTLLGVRLLVGRPIEDMKNRAFKPEEIYSMLMSLDGDGYVAAAEKIVFSRTLTEPRSARTRIEREFDPDVVRRLKTEVLPGSCAADTGIGG
jgi:hypothetical protein